MSQPFDTLAFAKRLELADIPREHAEAHAEAIRDHVMRDLATKADIQQMIEGSELRMTIRLGGIAVVAAGLVIGAMALILRAGLT